MTMHPVLGVGIAPGVLLLGFAIVAALPGIERYFPQREPPVRRSETG